MQKLLSKRFSTQDLLDKIGDEITEQGFCLVENVIEIETLAVLLNTFEQESQSKHARVHDGETYALRNILKSVPHVEEVAGTRPLFSIVQSILGSDARPVKAILFDKTEKMNWNLRWHQDNVIAVKRRIESPGFHGWSEKIGIPHVRPPVEILQSMLAARIHLDDCPAENAALKVIPKSHLHGRLEVDELEAWTIGSKSSPIICPARKGDVLFMRPLLLHASARAEKPQHRRVLHIEYAGTDLPFGLEWGE